MGKFLRGSILVLFFQLIVYINASYSEYPVINSFGQVGLVEINAAKNLGFTRLVFMTYADFAYDTRFVSQLIDEYHQNSLSMDTLSPEIAIGNIRPSIAFGVTSFFDLSLTLPIYMDMMSHYMPEAGLGDLELGLKVGIPAKRPRKNHGALLTSLSFPTGSKDQGYFPRQSYYFNKDSASDQIPADFLEGCYSSQKMETAFQALYTLDLNWFLLHVSSGVRFTFNRELDELLVLGAGLELRPSNWFVFFTEMSAKTRFENIGKGFLIADDPLRITPGITMMSPGGTSFSLSGSFKLSSNKHIYYRGIGDSAPLQFTSRLEPSWRVAAQLGWSGLLLARDRDKDQIPDKDDACPDDPEDIDGFEDSDGCPDLDNDNDGIPDTMDKCPNEPEDFDGFEDEDGCPDPDNDNDNIPDSIDQCINVAEDFDGFEDHDGCPEYDNDKDGIPDSLDLCISVPEDIDGFEDHDGCPDIDNDMDGVPDSVDRCPDVPGDPEEQGCPKQKPKAKEIKKGRVILRGVDFAGGSAVLNSESFMVLDQVYESLVEWEEVRLEIQSHTDNAGVSASNLKLSQKRAEAVRDYLTAKGIDKNRLKARGKGDTEPIADNSSVHGRRLNNRIEIHREN